MLRVNNIVTLRAVFLTAIMCTTLIINTFAQDSLNVITDLTTLKTKPSHLEARNYLRLEWQTGNVYLFNEQVLLNQEIRYDLDNNLIEIKGQNVTKIMEGFKIRRFEWIGDNHEKSLFANCAGYQYPTWTEGFYRILTEGKVSLLERTAIVEKVDHVTGAQEVEMFVKDDKPDELEEILYVAEGNLVHDLGRKKEILNYFGDKAPQVEAYRKEHRLNFRGKKDLIQIVEYYNSLP